MTSGKREPSHGGRHQGPRAVEREQSHATPRPLGGRHAPVSAVCLVLGMLGLAGCARMRTGSPPRAIRGALAAEQVREGAVLLARGQSGRAVHAELGAAPLGLPAPSVPPHPFMAPHGGSCMHTDPATTNVHAGPGPLGVDPEVVSRSMGFLGGECPTINFDRKGRIVTVCVRDRRPSLYLLDAESLTLLDKLPLPRRRTPLLRIRKIMEDTSGGAYFYLDERDRAVIGTAAGDVQVVGIQEHDEGPKLVLERRIELGHVLHTRDGRDDKLTAVLPDYDGNLWFAGRSGTVGLVGRDGRVHTRHLPGEQVENALSVAPDGVYLVSDHALYRFGVAAGGAPHAVWREPYDRGTRRKLGQILQGSGTTPTLLGSDYVAIADNAEPRMNVLVYRRTGARAEKLCSVPVFAPGQSATENTLVGYQRSLIVENNAGYDIFRTMRGGRTSAPGIARIDLRADDSGCDLVWQSDEVAQTSVPKLSAATGLVYVYTKAEDAPQGVDAYYFTALDFHTGRTVFRIPTGTGVRFDNNWAAIALAPDGSAYVGVLNGLVRVRDGRAAPAAVPGEAAPSTPKLTVATRR